MSLASVIVIVFLLWLFFGGKKTSVNTQRKYDSNKVDKPKVQGEYPRQDTDIPRGPGEYPRQNTDIPRGPGEYPKPGVDIPIIQKVVSREDEERARMEEIIKKRQSK